MAWKLGTPLFSGRPQSGKQWFSRAHTRCDVSIPLISRQNYCQNPTTMVWRSCDVSLSLFFYPWHPQTFHPPSFKICVPQCVCQCWWGWSFFEEDHNDHLNQKHQSNHVLSGVVMEMAVAATTTGPVGSYKVSHAPGHQVLCFQTTLWFVWVHVAVDSERWCCQKLMSSQNCSFTLHLLAQELQMCQPSPSACLLLLLLLVEIGDAQINQTFSAANDLFPFTLFPWKKLTFCQFQEMRQQYLTQQLLQFIHCNRFLGFILHLSETTRPGRSGIFPRGQVQS